MKDDGSQFNAIYLEDIRNGNSQGFSIKNRQISFHLSLDKSEMMVIAIDRSYRELDKIYDVRVEIDPYKLLKFLKNRLENN